MTGKMEARAFSTQAPLALQIVLNNSSGCTGMLAMTRAWGERYRAEVRESKVCEVAKKHFSADDLRCTCIRPGYLWTNRPDNYDEWLQRYKEEEQLNDWRDWRQLWEDLNVNLYEGNHDPPSPLPDDYPSVGSFEGT